MQVLGHCTLRSAPQLRQKRKPPPSTAVQALPCDHGLHEVAPCASPNLTCSTEKLCLEHLRIWSDLGQSIQV